mgnify:CR=1 FL=1
MIRIAVAGAGVIGREHVRCIQATAGAELAGIADPATGPYRDLASLLAAEKPDAVVIAAPNALHHQLALQAIEAKIAVLVEKPVCVTVEEALALAEAAEKNNVIALVGHHRRHSQSLARAKGIIQGGRLGVIAAVNGLCWFRKPGSYFEDAGEWRKQAGVIPINLIHLIDDLRYLCGEIIAVQATAANAIRGFDVEDTAALTLRFANGALASVSISDAIASPWSWELTAGENPVYPRTEEFCYLIGGTEASLSLPRLELWQQADWHQPIHRDRFTPPVEDPLLRQMQHFVALLQNEEHEPRIGLREAARTLAVTLAVQQSARSGHTIQL